ncbi:equilibrative nucleoside transporter 2 [Panthera uncia]|uniref:equilibrative nucleoside transporter 2 n=1 Tax=Panthera uncia TaxID=29064 RepID=UPI0020FFE3C0|nr:equilibrative nucleoside transporter 2 [Panthera uncia]
MVKYFTEVFSLDCPGEEEADAMLEEEMSGSAVGSFCSPNFAEISDIVCLSATTWPMVALRQECLQLGSRRLCRPLALQLCNSDDDDDDDDDDYYFDFTEAQPPAPTMPAKGIYLPAWGRLALSLVSRSTQLRAALQDRWRQTLRLPLGEPAPRRARRHPARHGSGTTSELAEGEAAAPEVRDGRPRTGETAGDLPGAAASKPHGMARVAVRAGSASSRFVPAPFGETRPPPRSVYRPQDTASRVFWPPGPGSALRRGRPGRRGGGAAAEASRPRGDLLTDPHSYHLVGISFFILGLGTLLPWNFFITAIPYFQGRLAGANNTAGTLGTNHTGPADTFNFNNWVTLLSQLPLLLFTLLNSFLYQCIPETVRILGSLLAILLLFALTAVLVKVDMSPGPFFSITMASVWFINSFCAVLQGSLFGQLGTMPSTYSTLFLSGQGLAGIFAALAMLMAMASGVDAQTSALGYFVTPCVGIFTSIVCYLSLPHLEFARYYLAKKPLQAQGQELETKAELLQSDEKNSIPNSPQKVALTLDLDAEKEPELEPEEIQKPGKPSVFIVFQKIWLTALCLVLVFAVTLSVFPAITAMVTSSTSPGKWSECWEAEQGRAGEREGGGMKGRRREEEGGTRMSPLSLPGQFFNPICCFLLFNIMDWVGRSLTSYFLWPDEDSRLLPLLVCLRVLFVPLFMLCHVPERSRLPVLFPQDAYFITFMLLFAVSNGYLMSLTMCLAPRQVLPHEREVAGTLMTFFLALGLSCGAALSFLFKALL